MTGAALLLLLALPAAADSYDDEPPPKKEIEAPEAPAAGPTAAASDELKDLTEGDLQRLKAELAKKSPGLQAALDGTPAKTAALAEHRGKLARIEEALRRLRARRYLAEARLLKELLANLMETRARSDKPAVAMGETSEAANYREVPAHMVRVSGISLARIAGDPAFSALKKKLDALPGTALAVHGDMLEVKPEHEWEARKFFTYVRKLFRISLQAALREGAPKDAVGELAEWGRKTYFVLTPRLYEYHGPQGAFMAEAVLQEREAAGLR